MYNPFPCHTIGRLTVNPSLFLNPSSTLDQSLGVTDGASSFPIDFSADISSMQPYFANSVFHIWSLLTLHGKSSGKFARRGSDTDKKFIFN